jgi:WD40 repeat protein
MSPTKHKLFFVSVLFLSMALSHTLPLKLKSSMASMHKRKLLQNRPINKESNSFSASSSSNEKNNIYVWNTKTGQLEYKLIGHSDTVWTTLAFGSDVLTSASEDGTIVVWNTTTRSIKFNLTQNCNQNLVTKMVKLDRDLFVSDCDNLEIWNVTSGQRVRSIPADNSVYLTKINETLIGDVNSSGSLSNQIALYDTATGQIIGSLNELGLYLYVMGYSSDLMVAYGAHSFDDFTLVLQVWNLTSGEKKFDFKDNYFMPTAKLGTNLLACQYLSDDIFISILDLSTNGNIILNITGHTGLIGEILPLSNGLMASKSVDNTTRIWNWTTGELIHTFNEYTYSSEIDTGIFPLTIAQLEANPDILVSSAIDTIHLWNLSTGKLEFELKPSFTSDCYWRLTEFSNGLLATICSDWD